MNRRRMMMLQQSKVDLLEGYRYDNPYSKYWNTITWLDNNTIHLTHTRSGAAGFGGSPQCGKAFIGCATASSSYLYCFSSTPMATLEYGKTYKLTLTVIEMAENTATVEDDCTLLLVLGYNQYHRTTSEINFSDIKVGTKIEVSCQHINSSKCISTAVFNFNNPYVKWDIKFKVDFEEVEE